MKTRYGINPDYLDHDEIDHDAAEALDDFDNGMITLDELKEHIGPEGVRALLERLEDEGEIHRLFDDPEDY